MKVIVKFLPEKLAFVFEVYDAEDNLVSSSVLSVYDVVLTGEESI